MREVCTATRGVRWIAALAAAVLVAGCGTRLSDARIEAAAGVNQGGPAPSAPAGATGAAAVPAGGAVADTAGAAAANPGVAAAPSVAPGASSRSSAAAARPGVPGAGGAVAGPSGASAGGARASGAAGGPAPAAAPGAAAAPVPGGGSAPAPGQAAPAKEPIVFGHIGDYSGIVGTVTRGGDVTAQIVARYVNDHGGVDGHPMKIITADAGGDPARALSLTRDMVENKGAVAFMGSLWVFSGYGPKDYLNERKIPVIGGDSTTRAWLDSPMYFVSSASFPSIGTAAAKGLADLGKKKIGVVWCVEAEQCKTFHDSAVARAPSFGAQVVWDAQVSLAQPDFTAECLQAQRNGAEGIVTGIDGPSIVRFMRACVQQGYRPQIMTASLAIIESIAKDPNLDGLQGPVGNFPHMATDLPLEREYHDAIARYAPTLASSPATTTVWTAGMLLVEVAKHGLPAGKVASADFLPGLYTIQNNTIGGLVGPLTFHEGKPADSVNCVFYIKIAGGKFVPSDGSKQVCF